MEEQYLYKSIFESIRGQILERKLKPGDRLPAVREMATRWNCTVGTIQRAYKELSKQGLVTSRAGQGTHVIDQPASSIIAPLRKAALIHRAEAFLLEVITAGHSPEEIDQAFHMALDRWRTVEKLPDLPLERVARFAGSHDLAVNWLGAHFPEILPDYALQLSFTGSLSGLIALSQGRADFAGCHLWDRESETYNEPFVRRILPGQKVLQVTLAHRSLGLIVAAGNPKKIFKIEDLISSGLRFVNRQAGSGTRIWLDEYLQKVYADTANILGYTDEKNTHSEVAGVVAEQQADAGLGLEASANAYRLGFVPLLLEQYDLIIPASNLEKIAIQRLCDWLSSSDARKVIANLGGYETHQTGQATWIR